MHPDSKNPAKTDNKTYKAIQSSDRSHLEKQVEEQTAALLQTNERLKQEIVRRKRAERMLLQQIEGERVLRAVAERICQSFNLEEALNTAVCELTVSLNLSGCDAALYNADQTAATICCEYAPGLPTIQEKAIRMADFPEGYDQLQRGLFFQFCELVPGSRGAVVKLACPIVDDQGVLGDLWMFKPPHDAFDELETRLVQQVANQCAIAIRQARLYQAAQAQVEEQKKLNHLKDDFLSTVSHELRTPVTNMKMALQMLGITLNREQGLFAELTKPPAEQKRVARYFQILHNECEREITLISDLLDLQRLYAGVQPLVLTSIQIQDWLPPIVEPFQERVQGNQQSLQIKFSGALPRFICDPASLGRIVVELLDNACKYTPTGQQIAIAVQSQSGMMQISVCNSGVEIPESELSRIFDKFYRIPNTDCWKQGGTGLGLTLVQQLVAHLEGTIHVESAAGQTRFIVELPLHPKG